MSPNPTSTLTPGPQEQRDEEIAEMMLAALRPYGVVKVVIADARDKGGDRLAFTWLRLSEEAKSTSDLNEPLGAVLVVAYRATRSEALDADLDGIATIVYTPQGAATAIIAARMSDIADYFEGKITPGEFVDKWIVMDL